MLSVGYLSVDCLSLMIVALPSVHKALCSDKFPCKQRNKQGKLTKKASNYHSTFKVFWIMRIVPQNLTGNLILKNREILIDINDVLAI